MTVSVESAYRLQLVDNRQVLADYQEALLALFQRSYGFPLDAALWRWAYLDNCQGDALVSLCFSDDKIVGHYAVIPMNFVQHGKPLRAALSMTTMVDPSFRGRGLFVKQAEHVYRALAARGFDFVYGFPNHQSVHGFKKYLNWQIEAEDYVACLTVDQLLASPELQHHLNQQALIKLDLHDADLLQWRLNKPGERYYQKGNTILKDFNDGMDIVTLGEDFEDQLEPDRKYNVLLDSSMTALKPFEKFNYQFGYRIFNPAISHLSMKKDLLLSDVF